MFLALTLRILQKPPLYKILTFWLFLKIFHIWQFLQVSYRLTDFINFNVIFKEINSYLQNWEKLRYYLFQFCSYFINTILKPLKTIIWRRKLVLWATCTIYTFFRTRFCYFMFFIWIKIIFLYLHVLFYILTTDISYIANLARKIIF